MEKNQNYVTWIQIALWSSYLLDLRKDVAARVDASNCELERPVPRGKMEKQLD